MLNIKIKITSKAFMLLPLLLLTAAAYPQQKNGARLAQDIIALISYLELSNIGARDIECKGTPFEITDINAVIEGELRPALSRLAASEGGNHASQTEEIIDMVKKINKSKKDGQNILQTLYKKAKDDNFLTYGNQAGCAALSASFRSISHQRRLSIKNSL